MPDFGLDRATVLRLLNLLSSSNIVTDIDTQTFTNKTHDVNLNTIKQTTPSLGSLLKDNGTKYLPFPKGTADQVLRVNSSGTDLVWSTIVTGGSGNVSTGTSNTYGDFDQIFRFGRIKTRNAANTFDHAIQSLATAARTWSIPDNSDTAAGLAATQTLTNKTLNATNNTITDTSTSLGDILKSDGTKFTRLARGTANQVLTVNSGGTDVSWAAGGGGGGNVSTGQINTYGDFDQIFRYGRIKTRNSTNTFDHAIQSLSTAARTWSLPDVSDTAAGTAATQTLTNKTVNATNNTITDTSTALGDLLKSDGTKFTRLGRGTANQVLTVNSGGTDISWAALAAGGGNVSTGQINTYGDFDQIFRNSRVKVRNAANTFDHSLASLSTAARTWTLPDVTDTGVGLAATQTLTNKTVNATNNTITDTSTAAGDILKSDGSKFVRLGRGTASQVLAVNTGGTDLNWVTPAAGGGGTATNVYDYVVYFSTPNYVAMDATGATITNTNFSTLMSTLNSNLSTAGGSIFIKKGTYDITSEIDITNSISIFGAGRGKTILRRVMNTINTVTLSVTGSNLTISTLTIDGNQSANTTNNQSELSLGGNNVLIRDVEIKNWQGLGIVSRGHPNIITDCQLIGSNVPNSSYDAIWTDDPGAKTIISKCTATGCFYGAFWVGGYTEISDCYITNTSSEVGGQIALSNSNGIFTSVVNCVIDIGNTYGTNGACGIEIDSGDLVAVGNRINNQAWYGIVKNNFGTSDKFILANNIIKNCGREGIQVLNAEHNFTIQGNIIYDDQATHTQAYGINIINAGSDYFIIKDNICYGNTTANIRVVPTTSNKIVSDNLTHA